MLHVGLTGGLASGKSFVGRNLETLGCLLIQADQLGHQVLEPGGEAYHGVVELFGREILEPGGRIDRRKLAAMVFASPDALAKQIALVHPPVQARGRALAEAFFKEHPDGIAVTEAAILIETGRFRDFARLIVAVCTPEQQIQRAMDRDGITRQEALDRIRWQMPLDEKVKYADYVIDTSGPKERTVEQTRKVFESLQSLRSKQI